MVYFVSCVGVFFENIGEVLKSSSVVFDVFFHGGSGFAIGNQKTMIQTEAFCFDKKLRQVLKDDPWSKDSRSYQGAKFCRLGLPGYIVHMYL